MSIDYQIVIDKTSKRVLRSGYCDLLNDGQFDTETEEHHIADGSDIITIRDDWYYVDDQFTQDVPSGALAEYKAAKYAAMKSEIEGFIEQQGYTAERQDVFAPLLVMALDEGLTNRAAYIKSGYTWAAKVRSYYYLCYGQVLQAADKVAVDAVTLNLEPYNPPYDPDTRPDGDPQVSLYEAEQIMD